MRWIPIAAVVLVLTSCVGDGPSWRDLGGICATPRAGVDRQGTLDDEKKFLRAWTAYEARLKCAGSGIGGLPQPQLEEAWVAELEVGTRAAAAVAARRGPRDLRTWAWS